MRITDSLPKDDHLVMSVSCDLFTARLFHRPPGNSHFAEVDRVESVALLDAKRPYSTLMFSRKKRKGRKGKRQLNQCCLSTTFDSSFFWYHSGTHASNGLKIGTPMPAMSSTSPHIRPHSNETFRSTGKILSANVRSHNCLYGRHGFTLQSFKRLAADGRQCTRNGRDCPPCPLPNCESDFQIFSRRHESRHGCCTFQQHQSQLGHRVVHIDSTLKCL